jgi:DNA-directed RNA polymerase subunit N (RpoN/RPB10)
MTGYISPTATLDPHVRSISALRCWRCGKPIGRGFYEDVVIESTRFGDPGYLFAEHAIQHGACAEAGRSPREEACRGR